MLCFSRFCQVGLLVAGSIYGLTAGAQTAATEADAPAVRSVADFLKGMTVNGMLDTYYEYNFNQPIGRVNYLRAYDVSSNNFSLNQADLMFESAPDMGADKRFGMRVDLQYGQATSTLQGSSANELRPDVYRNIYQAYGSYWIPIRGTLLQLDFGKWASSLGIEGNYTKDQMNYSRSFWFQFLPFYHSGLRASYKVGDQVAVNYWITNGTQQTEAFNNFKDQLIGFTYTPRTNLTWTFNYYLGQEHPDITYVTGSAPGSPDLPNQQGNSFQPIPNAPNGRLEIYDTYATWQVTPKFTLAAEADHVISRLYTYSPGQHASGGALYARYQLDPKVALAVRGEYMTDADGLYSGIPQSLKEGTLTVEYKVTEGFLARAELRRDASNRSYFLTNTLGLLSSQQATLGFGLVWWLGQKDGAW
jgi:Putative beta-barrel porin-2, OmpL-like. bbp2